MRNTRQTRAILTLLGHDPDQDWYGLELLKKAGLKSGTVYPILARLERTGLVVS